MRVFALRDEANEAAGNLAYLECYEDSHACYFELPPGADCWDLPFILFEFAKRGVFTIDAQWSMIWVQSHIVPPERQNLGEILKVNGLDEYDELRLLELTEGRCAQDACYLVPVGCNELPGWYEERKATRLLDAYHLEAYRLVAAFCDGRIVVCDMAEELNDRREFSLVLSDEKRFARMRLQPGGHGVMWGDALQVSCDELAGCGIDLPLSTGDVADLLNQVVYSTSEAAEILGCSRQNVVDLVRRGRLVPIKATGHVTLFLRSDILAYRLNLSVR